MGLKAYMGKNEQTAVVTICLLFALIGAILILSTMKPFGTAYEDVQITYSLQGENLLIQEAHVTRVGSIDTFNVLYRSFGETICRTTTGSDFGTNSNCNVIIQDVTCSKGTPYFSPYIGDAINMETGETFKPRYSYKIKSREVGCYSDEEFSNEKSTLAITYHVPLTHVQKNAFKHILFSEDHFAINTLSTNGLEKQTTQNYLAKNGQVSIDVRTGDIDIKGTPYSVQIIVWIILALLPYIIWNAYGKEKHFTVPKYLHVVPNKKTAPWQVDVLTNGKNEMSKNGMAGILMELYVADIVIVDVVKKTFKKTYEFKVDSQKDSSKISAKAKTFLDHLLQNKIRKEGKYAVCTLQAEKTSMMNSMKNQAFMQSFFKQGDVKIYLDETFDKKGTYFMIGYFVAVIIAFLALGYVKNPQSIYFFIFIFIGIGAIFPKSLFSRFKEDRYKEYLEWYSFNNMLQDYAKIQQYLKADKYMWKEWLTYAAALGSADKLLKSMKELNILSPVEYERTSTMYTHFIAYSILSNTMANPRSSGSGGGIGGGGGFGGGGGGGR